jgi:hypothetical protein
LHTAFCKIKENLLNKSDFKSESEEDGHFSHDVNHTLISEESKSEKHQNFTINLQASFTKASNSASCDASVFSSDRRAMVCSSKLLRPYIHLCQLCFVRFENFAHYPEKLDYTGKKQ